MCNLVKLVLFASGPALIFPKPDWSSSVLNEINKLTLQVAKLDAMLNLVVRNLAKLLLLILCSLLASETSLILNEINRIAPAGTQT